MQIIIRSFMSDLLLELLSTSLNINTVLISFLALMFFALYKRPRKIVLMTPQDNIKYHRVDGILSKDEKRVLEVLISKKGGALQSEVTKITKLHRWQTSRILSRFENSGWIVRKPYGMTKIIYMNIEFE